MFIVREINGEEVTFQLDEEEIEQVYEQERRKIAHREIYEYVAKKLNAPLLAHSVCTEEDFVNEYLDYAGDCVASDVTVEQAVNAASLYAYGVNISCLLERTGD